MPKSDDNNTPAVPPTSKAQRIVAAIEGDLHIAEGPVPSGCTRVRVLRNHDANAFRLLRKGEVWDLLTPYVRQQTEFVEGGHKIRVEPPVFEIVS